MDYLVELLEKELLYQKGIQKEVIDLQVNRILAEKKGEEAELSRKELDDFSKKIVDTEVRLKAAIRCYKDSHEVDDKDIGALLQKILNGYEQNKTVRINENPTYKILAAKIREKEDEISCVVDYNGRLFDPRLDEKWYERDLKEGDEVKFYLHNLKDGEHNLNDFVNDIGTVVEQEKLEGIGPSQNGMIRRTLELENQYGIHARPAALFVQTASRFGCEIEVEKDGIIVSGKSIMGLMTLEAGYGARLNIKVKGPGAEEVLDELERLVKDKFGED